MLKGFKRGLLATNLAALILGCSAGEKISGPSNPPPNNPPPIEQNHNPTISSSPVISVDENHNYYYQIQRSDPDGDNTTCTVAGPSWISANNCLITGIAPEVSSDQSFPVTITAVDEHGASSTPQNYSLSVKNLFNIYSLSSSQQAGLQVTDTNLVFSKPVSFAVGDIVSSGVSSTTPSGFLRQVISVSHDKTSVATKNAVLEDIVREAVISNYTSLLPSQVRSFTGLQGVSRSVNSTQDFNFKLNFNNVVLYDYDGNSATTDDQIIANGSVNFDAGFDFDLSIKNFKLENLMFQQILNESSDITIGSNLLGMAASYKVKIAEYSLAPVVIGVIPTFPPIPLIITPKIEIDAGVNLTKANPLSFRVRQDMVLNGGIKYNNNSWTPILNFSNLFDFTIPEVTGELGITAFAGPTLKLPFYGVAGPSANALINMTLQSADGNWKLYGGFDASASVSAEVLSHLIASYSVPLIDFDTLLTQGAMQSTPKIAYVTDLGNATSVIATINPDGTGSRTVTSSDFLANEPRWSPDRKELAYSQFVGNGRMDIHILGNNPRTITSTGVNFPGSWSPDGNKMVISSRRDNNTDIYTINPLDGSGLTRLTTDPAEETSPVWSSDNWIYFSKLTSSGRTICRMRPNGDSLSVIIPGSLNADEVDISPDGKQLLFDSYIDGIKKIIIWDLQGGTGRQLTDNLTINYHPRFSPDGTMMVYSSELIGSGSKIYIMKLDGTSRGQITGGNNDKNPDW